MYVSFIYWPNLHDSHLNHPYLISNVSYMKCFFYIFIPVPDDGFMRKSKYVARLGNKMYCLKIHLSLTFCLFL